MSIWNPKANSLFLQAIELPSSDRRTGLLDEACAGDPALRAEVEQLLKAHDNAGSFLERPLLDEQRTQDFAAATDPDSPPTTSISARAELSLDFLEPCDVPGRLGKIGPYEVIDVIGAGGMGVVLRAHEPKLNRIVAVKVIAPQLVVNPTVRKRFLREAQAAAAVTHPNVVVIHAVEQTDKMSYLVMECINGPSLEEKIDRCGHLELKEILRIGAQVAAGLAAAHAQGLVHRDIKPSNILLENGIERVRITDFGLARAVDDVGLTCSGEVAGTPQFMSPEQAQGKPLDHRSDLFSLGAVLYTMCTGRSPFRAETTVAVLRRVCDDVPRPIREVNPDIPEQLVTIIDRLLAKAPEERFQTAQEVADLLLSYLADLQDPASTPLPEALPGGPATDQKTPAAGAAPIDRRSRRTVLLAATVLLGLCIPLAVTEATGVTHLAAAVLRIATGAGTLVVEVDDPQVSLTIDGEDLVITGTGPKEVRLKPGQYRVLASKDGQLVKQELVTIERGGRQVLRVELEPSATPPAAMTSSIATHGLGGLDKIAPITFPSLWRTDRDFAKISSAGEMVFPKIPVSRYVLETELTIRNPQEGRVLYKIVDAGWATELSLGFTWPKDRTVSIAACRLFCGQPSGSFWWVGEEHFPTSQRLAFKLIVADHERTLFYNEKRVLGNGNTPVDCTLKITAEGTPDCTIHTCSLRPLSENDMEAIGHEVPPCDLKLDPEKTARRIREQTGGLPDVAETGKPFVVKSIDAALRWIPAGEFTMGPEANGKGKHRVRLSQGFWIGQYTVTQGEWSRLFTTNPSRFRGSPYLPVNWVSWEDGMRFCAELDSRERKAGRVPAGYQYRLPTEAEWEYACKAAPDEDQPKYPPDCWWGDNSGYRLHEVGELPPNHWGLYDMCGNAAQWCLDVWQDYPPKSATVLEDPCRFRQSNDDRLCLRGGGWWRTHRDEFQPTSRDKSRSVAVGYRGFRIVLAKTLTGTDSGIGPK